MGESHVRVRSLRAEIAHFRKMLADHLDSIKRAHRTKLTIEETQLKTMEERFEELKKKYGNKVQIAFKHFPLPMHKEAKPASEASMCINEQSGDKFWKYHDLLFKNQDKLDNASLEKYAKDVGADVAHAGRV